MQSATAAGNLDFDELYILSGLLQMPGNVAYEFVLDLRESWTWLEEAARDLEGVELADWQEEYIALFLHRGTELSCPPFESDYCDDDSSDAGAIRMARFHMRAGVQVTNLPPDYLGSELRFLAQLLEYEGNDLDPDLIDEVSARLRSWVPRFGRDLQARSRLALYRALGKRLEQLFS